MFSAMLLPGAPARAAGHAPERMMVGDSRLTLASQGTRERLFVNLYRVSLYAPTEAPDLNTLHRSGVAKALRIEVLYGGDMPESIPSGWKEELLPRLNEQDLQKLRQAYAHLDEGDVVTVEYAPSTGTRIQVNGNMVLTDPGGTLMNGFIEIFLGRNPVSAELKNQLLGQG
jgi:hypothetical protein